MELNLYIYSGLGNIIALVDLLREDLSLSPEEVVKIAELEGVEFIRGIYCVDGVKQRNSNFWNFENKIPSSFYDGSTGIEPIDNTIKKVLKNAYAHHIERLMVLGNFMLLLEIKPSLVYKWFMEL